MRVGALCIVPYYYLSLPIMESIVVFKALLGAALAASLGGAIRAAEPGRYLLEPEAVWSAGDAAPHAGWVVAVEGDKISGVRPTASLKAPTRAHGIPLSGKPLVPRL